ncbi:hypothetical protein Mgra_00007750 [Meloidogyne graminicola]|uniref:Uncharacterized protein n=1 Tax=Meloidogyne graminicola TaxID=189291 RepID=A0A8S9ZHQ6_9BILA|nr:hypothetical protein Mgra_00007750 [Meloidogyne graminicola]
MIGLFNIPCDSPIEFYKVMSSKNHFTFQLSPEENLMISTFEGKEKGNKDEKYLADGRKLIEGGKQFETLSSEEVWRLLIIRSQLLICFNSQLKFTKPSTKPVSILSYSRRTQIARRHAFRIPFKRVAESLKKYK